MKRINEGEAVVELHTKKIPTKDMPVFYNPLMKKNRDLTLLFLLSIARKELQCCDLLAGSGVRAVRMLKELPNGMIKRLVINDLSPEFAKRMQRTLKENAIDHPGIVVTERDANQLLLDTEGFDYIDIDPFGSPNAFLDNAIVRLSRKGILAVTATDTAALSGNRMNAGRRKYWAEPLNNEIGHELGLRILIRKVQLLGAQHDKALTPLFSYFSDYYFRVFFFCEKGRQKVDALLKHHAFFHYCNTCMQQRTSAYNKELCCGKQMLLAGPLWTGVLSEKAVVQKMISLTEDEPLQKFLQSMEGDMLPIVGFYDLHMMGKKKLLGQLPKMETVFSEKLLRTHFAATAVKTSQWRDVHRLLRQN